MSDPGFDFKAAERRAAKRFEPPPWEREAFEELQRKRAEVEPKPPEPTNQTVVTEEQEGSPVEQAVSVTEGPAEEVAVAVEKNELDERQVIEMMALLAEEEPKLQEQTWKLALASALFVSALGSVMIVWGFAALVRARGTGVIGVAGALVLAVFGILFVSIAAWMAVRTLRQRGVL